MSVASLAELIEYQARQKPNDLFLSSPEKQIDLTYGSFVTRAAALARHLRLNGFRKGWRVIVLLENGIDWAIAFWGILLAGGVAVPLNPRLKMREADELIKQSEAYCVIADETGMKLLPGDWIVDETVVQNIGFDKLFVISFSGGIHGETEIERITAEDEALLLFTSGSSGVPKGVRLTHGNLLAEADFIRQGHALTDKDIVLCILPFFHINGLVITLITPVLTGSRTIIPKKFSASQFWRWINRYQATWFSAVPTILSILLSQDRQTDITAPSLRFVRSASSSLPVAVLEEFENRYGVPVIEAYGLSETGSQVATNPLPPEIRKAGSVGKAVGNEIRVVDQQGKIVLNGVTGEVIIKGPNVLKEYLNNPEANRESFKDGWFYSGDLGRFDHDGYLFLTGRRKELINRAGEKISPREVDEVLYRLPGIETAAAVGVPDLLFGEEIVAFVKLRPDKSLSQEQIIAYCKEYLADFKVPKHIFLIEDFPKGPNGKIQRIRLVELYKEMCSQECRERGF